MTTEQLNEMMEQGNLGYACVFRKEDQGKHRDFLFPMTAENIANFIGQNAFTAEKIIMTDFCDSLICESIYGGFLMSCPDQNLCKQIIPHLAAIQQGENDPKEFPVATREEGVFSLWKPPFQNVDGQGCGSAHPRPPNHGRERLWRIYPRRALGNSTAGAARQRVNHRKRRRFCALDEQLPAVLFVARRRGIYHTKTMRTRDAHRLLFQVGLFLRLGQLGRLLGLVLSQKRHDYDHTFPLRTKAQKGNETLCH